jgi:hypothetical protein
VNSGFEIGHQTYTNGASIGKKGDVIAEQWSENRGERNSVALFFGYLDDWTICEEYRGMVKEKSRTKIRCVENR